MQTIAGLIPYNFTSKPVFLARSRPYVPRMYVPGNYCGHDPENPRFHLYKAPKHKLLPIQTKAQEKIKAFYSNPDLLPQLTRVLSNGQERTKNRNGQRRRVSSERRETVSLVMLYVIGKLNFATSELGFRRYHDGKTMGISIDTIAEELGINYSAVQEALSHLYHANYMTYTERYEPFKRKNEIDGSIESYDRRVISIRTVQPTFFLDLGISYKDQTSAKEYAKQKWRDNRVKFFAEKSQGGNKPHVSSYKHVIIKKPGMEAEVVDISSAVNIKDIGERSIRQARLALEDPYNPPPPI